MEAMSLEICPACGKEGVCAHFFRCGLYVRLSCPECGFAIEKPSYEKSAEQTTKELLDICRILTERRTPKIEETAVFDKEETYTDCTVQVLENTLTGEVSVGWRQNGKGGED